jgi:uncharacterized protein (DUF2345 family)
MRTGNSLRWRLSKVFFSKHCSRPKLGRRGQGSRGRDRDYDRQKALLNESLSQLKKAGILISAPAGMALASRTDLQCTAAENLIATAGGHAVSASQNASRWPRASYFYLCAEAASSYWPRAQVELQAQSDEMRLLADKHVTITSANGRVVIEAKDELLLKCGGSYLRMSSTGIEDGTRGDRTSSRRHSADNGSLENEHVEAREISRHLCPSESIDREPLSTLPLKLSETTARDSR